MRMVGKLVFAAGLTCAVAAGTGVVTSAAARSAEPDPPVGYERPEPGVRVDLTNLPAVETAQGRRARALEARRAPARTVLVATASWCPPCGGERALDPVMSSARKNPHARYEVLLVMEPEESVRRLAVQASALPNVTIRWVGEPADQAALPERMRLGVPSAAVVSADGLLEAVAVGKAPTGELLERP